MSIMPETIIDSKLDKRIRLIEDYDASKAFEEYKRYVNGDPCKLVNSMFRIRDNKGRLGDYTITEPHAQLLRSGILGDKTALYTVSNKGRQIGFSVFLGVEDLAIAKIYPNTFQYYAATKEDKAKDWLRKVETLSRDARLWFDGSRMIDIDERRSSQLEKWIRHLPNGVRKEIEYSYICGIAASPGGARGETAINISLDEFPWMIKTKNMQREMLASVKHFISQGGQLRIQGSPLIRSDEFWKIYSGAEERGYKAFYFPTITNWEQLDLNKSLLTQPYIIPYPWVDIKALEQDRMDDLDYFKQEVLGIPIDTLYRYIAPELLEDNCDSTTKDMRTDQKEVFIMAIDPAAVRDITSVTIGEVINGEIWERCIVELRGDYVVQSQEVMRLHDLFNPLEIRIDTTGGHGRGMADILDKTVLCPIRRIEFASSVEISDIKKIRMTEFLATEFKKALINHKYHLIEHRQAFIHCMNIERTVTTTGVVRYSGKKNGRDDHFMSKSMLNANFGIYAGGEAFGVQGGDSTRFNSTSLKRKRIEDYNMPSTGDGGFLTF